MPGKEMGEAGVSLSAEGCFSSRAQSICSFAGLFAEQQESQVTCYPFHKDTSSLSQTPLTSAWAKQDLDNFHKSCKAQTGQCNAKPKLWTPPLPLTPSPSPCLKIPLKNSIVWKPVSNWLILKCFAHFFVSFSAPEMSINVVSVRRKSWQIS